MTFNFPKDGVYEITGHLHFNKKQEAREGRIVIDGQIVRRQIHPSKQLQMTIETIQHLKAGEHIIEISAFSNSGIVEPLPSRSVQKIQ